MRTMLIIAIAFVCIGCGNSTKQAEDSKKVDEGPANASSVDGVALWVERNGARVALGDSIESAKEAFAAPDDATVYDTSLSLRILGIEGWAWMIEEEVYGFEVAFENGIVKAVSLADMSGPVSDESLDSQIAVYGEPTNEARGDNIIVRVWESGEYARFIISFKKELPFLGAGEMTLAGATDKLRLLNYHADNPQLTVDQLEAMFNIEFD